MSTRTHPPRLQPRLPAVGWREWVTLPDLGIVAVKAKVDTGARSSSLHAFDLEFFRRGRKDWVRFKVHPFQRDTKRTVQTEAELLEYRTVRSSGGHETLRPVIMTTVRLLERDWPIELTLASRDTMGFRMLLGRQALRGHYIVDPGRSYYNGIPRRKKKKPGSPPKKKSPRDADT